MHSKTKVVPVVSTKGGEGKSTQAANLAGFLADAGIKTFIIDGDHAQPTASSIYPLAYEAPCGLAHADRRPLQSRKHYFPNRDR